MKFKPTYLYIKQHIITGKLYFGKTIKNPEIYEGSGGHWKNHIKKHGKEHVATIWYCLFLDQETCTEFALKFSEQQNIVDSDEWMNKVVENGLDFCINIGRKHTPEEIKKRIDANTGKKRTEEQKQKMRKPKPEGFAQIVRERMLNTKMSSVSKAKISHALMGIRQSNETKLKRSITMSSLVWINNGEKNKRINESELNQYIELKWIKGRTKYVAI